MFGRHRCLSSILARVGLSLTDVSTHGLPHEVRSFKLSIDPNFAAKAEDIVGLYVDAPTHTVVT
jgi:hypothetical protein